MVKQRMNALDIKAAVEELRIATAGMRLINVYDVNPRVYLLKFGAGDKKVMVLIEVGVRVHITTYSREKPKVPSQFTLKLRKHVRSWRLDSIDQIGVDRVLDLKFGKESASFHFIIELYGKGNFILTDHEYTIMMLLRTRKDDDVKLAVREKYPLDGMTMLPPAPLGTPVVLEALTKAPLTESLKNTMNGISQGIFVPSAMEHALLNQGLKYTAAKKDWSKNGCEETIRNTAEMVTIALAECWKLHNAPMPLGGVLFKKSGGAAAAAAPSPAATAASGEDGAPTEGAAAAAAAPASVILRDENSTIFDEFSPIYYSQYDKADNSTIVKCRSFSEVVDKFFFPLEMVKIEEHNEKKDVAPKSKKDKFYQDHQRRIDQLTNEEDKNRRKGELINLNYEEVQEAIDLINMALASGIGWDRLQQVVKQRQHEGMPVANMIHELNLDRNTISLLIEEEIDEECEEGDGDVIPIIVDVDIGLTAHANACKYFTAKKANAKKLEKTISATDKAAQAAEKKGQRVAVKAGPSKKEIHRERPKYFFEKFYWFIATSGHLVLCAKDNQQADDLIKRYLHEGDVLVHCDIWGAPPCIVKALASSPIYIRTLEEAGTMSVCRSTAWESKQSVSAWWVYASQVSKTAPNGDYLNAGIFAVKGKKNFLQAMPLMFGAAVVFRSNIRTEYLALEGSDAIPADDPSVHSPPVRHGSPSSNPVDGMSRTHSNDGADSGDNTDDMLGDDADSPQPPQSPLVLGSSSAMTPKSPTASGGKHGSGSFPAAPINKKLSAKERRKAQKHSSNTSNASSYGGESSESGPSHTPESVSSRSQSRASSAGGSGQATTPSGMPKTKRQMNKLKKIQKKYGEQDDEDRERAMQLLGNDLSKTHKAMLEQQKPDKKGDPRSNSDEYSVEDEEMLGDGGDDEASSRARCVRFAAADDVVEAEHEAMRRRTTSFEDNEAQRQARIATELSDELPFLSTSPPEPTSSSAGPVDIPFAMVMCGPYPALIGAKYRVEITPGTEKKGQAAKQLMNYFQTMAGEQLSRKQEQCAQAQEGEAEGQPSASPQLEQSIVDVLRFVKDEEVIMQLVSGIKLHLKGASRNAGAEARKAMNGGTNSSRNNKHVDPEEGKKGNKRR